MVPETSGVKSEAKGEVNTEALRLVAQALFGDSPDGNEGVDPEVLRLEGKAFHMLMDAAAAIDTLRAEGDAMKADGERLRQALGAIGMIGLQANAGNRIARELHERGFSITLRAGSPVALDAARKPAK